MCISKSIWKIEDFEKQMLKFEKMLTFEDVQ